MNGRASARGFTLIEVLVAVVVLALSLTVLIVSGARNADAASHLHDKMLALWVAHNRLTELELQPTWPATGESNGDADMGQEKWRWRVNVRETEDAHLHRVDIDVVKASEPDAKSAYASLTTFISDVGRRAPQ